MPRNEGNWWMGAPYGVVRNSEIIARYCNVQSRWGEAGGQAGKRKDPAVADASREIRASEKR